MRRTELLQAEAAQWLGVSERSFRRSMHRYEAAWPGMMSQQGGSRHLWVPGVYWDLIVTMDDATNEHHSMVFVEEEGTASSFQGIREVIARWGLFCSLSTDRGSHYGQTGQASGKVDKGALTQFGRAMQQLGIEMIPAYSPQARGRSERAFETHQDRLVKELALAGISEIEEANRYLRQVYLPAYHAEFKRAPREQGSAFVPDQGGDLGEIVCEHHERVVGNDNCVSFAGLKLQIPGNTHRMYHGQFVRFLTEP